ncbi:MAG: DUF1887 family CARF protein [Calditrichia bacterium]
MSKTIINLVSAETIPNVLFIKENSDADEIIFISTERMEKQNKTEAIIAGADVNIPYKLLITSPDEPEKLEKDLNRLDLDYSNDILVNLTGGTKIMAIIVYQFFSRRGTRIYYQPIGKSYFERIFPYPVEKLQIEYKLNVQEYLRSYNVSIVSKAGRPEFSYEQCIHMFDTISKKNKEELFILREFRNNTRIQKLLKSKKKINIEEKYCKEAFDSLNTKNKTEENLHSICKEFCDTYPEITKTQLNWLLGGWLEELFWYALRKNHQLEDDYLEMNCQIVKENVKNEIDILVVKENKLHLFECKTGMKVKVGDIINETIYKVTSIKSKFGINAATWLITLEEGLKEHHLARAKESRLEIVRREELQHILNGDSIL